MGLPMIHQAMIEGKMDSATEVLKKKLCLALELGCFTKKEIANLCNVTASAVDGWIKTGRISKDNLFVVARHSGWPLEWWMSHLDLEPPTGQEANKKKLEVVLDSYYLIPEQIAEIVALVHETEQKNKEISEAAKLLHERHKSLSQIQKNSHDQKLSKITISQDEVPKIKIVKKHNQNRETG